ncbi:3-isopropylmalate dehydrogenase [Planomicrobium sp. YIM 101495]|uniref:3-isopropylmalate dehydrogenase n=1 Tax=Planomicrobium sp. YIM 101495 TaxID=2665160 RepID=UPI0012B7CE29|nr:3-isopropylmalate dehydrogenase [Planomicrobium sp. YIM 101495]MTD32221.1 3-isopropylmalate dehydrogenase [Planomicrobium sp. YIM 101495]
MEKTIAILPGDGIGPEVTAAAVKVLRTIAMRYGHSFTMKEADIGGAAIDRYGEPLPDETITACEQSDAILLGAVGGPKWDKNPADKRPEKGLLGIRKHFDLYANIRPVKAFPSLLSSSPLKKEVAENVDMVILRELTGGLYFGEPKRRNERSAIDTLVYTKEEIKRIVTQAFEIARTRRGKVTSVDKANVLETSKLWRQVVEEVREGYPDVDVDHLYVDAAAMKLITEPSTFDVIVTENMFGDILSDEASVITGSLGMLPSASVRADGFGLYEPVHGSAPDLAGENKANPSAAILSAAMMLRHSFGFHTEASAIEEAVKSVLEDGYGTGDVCGGDKQVVSTTRFAEKVIEEIEREFVSDHIMLSYV